MLERDKYEPDHCLSQFPNPSYQQYAAHMFAGVRFPRLFIQSYQFDKQQSIRTNLVFATVVVSLIPIITHKRIYWFRNYHSKKARVLFGLAWFFIPANILGAYFNSVSTRQLMTKYQINKDLFTRMLENGDINITNPRQQWAEF